MCVCVCVCVRASVFVGVVTVANDLRSGGTRMFHTTYTYTCKRAPTRIHKHTYIRKHTYTYTNTHTTCLASGLEGIIRLRQEVVIWIFSYIYHY